MTTSDGALVRRSRSHYDWEPSCGGGGGDV